MESKNKRTIRKETEFGLITEILDNAKQVKIISSAFKKTTEEMVNKFLFDNRLIISNTKFETFDIGSGYGILISYIINADDIDKLINE